VAFVNRGTLVYYKRLKNGDEAATDFAFAGDWVTNNHSRLSREPSLIGIKAIESCELLVISQENLEQCYLQIPAMERLGRILVEQAFVKIARQSIDLQTLSASQRYHKLLREHPEIIRKIPQYHIASYLGIAPKSLSRIRGEVLSGEDLL
jgi:CRP-like cAMP-binding protein